MTPELSRRVARAMHNAAPPPTRDERQYLIDVLRPDAVRTFGDLPADARDLVLRFESSGET